MNENSDYEDAILVALFKKETFRYRELFNEVQTIKKCTCRTFNKYLKEMVKEGIVNYTPKTKKENGMYWIDSGLRTVNSGIQYWLEKDLNSLDKLRDTVKSTLDFHNKNKNNTRENKKIKSRLLEKLVRQTVQWFHLYRMHMLIVVSGSVAKINEKTIMEFSELGLKKIEILFDQLKQSDRIMYDKFFMRVAYEMIRQGTSFR